MTDETIIDILEMFRAYLGIPVFWYLKVGGYII